MSKSLHTTSMLLLCFCLVLFLAGCGMNNSTANNSNNPPGGNNPGGSTPSSASETLYESFRTFDNATNGVRAFRVDPVNGALNQLSGFPITGAFQALFADPAGKLLFDVHSNNGSNATTAYQINSSTGVLTQGSDNPGVGGAIVFHPNGKFLYLVDSLRGTLAGFSFDSSGKMSPLPGSPYPTAGIPVGAMDLSPNGRFLYFATSDSNFSSPSQDRVVGYSVDANTGELKMLPGMPMQVRSFVPCECPSKKFAGIALKFDPAGQTLFIGDAGNGAIESFAVDQGTGAITKVASVPDRTGANEIAVTPNGKFLYDVGFGSAASEIRGFIVGSSSTLVPMPAGFTVPLGPETFVVTDIRIDPSGRFLYQGNNSGRFSGYTIDQSAGNLAPTGQVLSDNVPLGAAIVK